jgi:hypothetical protein
MENLVKVEGERHLYKDANTGVVLNNDKAGYEAYLAQCAVNKAKREQMNDIRQEVDNMKEDIAEIKQILKFLVEKL